MSARVAPVRLRRSRRIAALMAIAAGRRRVDPLQPAAAFPLVGPSAVRAQGRALHAQAVTPGQGQTVQRLGRARSATSARSSCATGARSSTLELDPEYERPRPHRRDRAAAAEDRPEGHARRARPRQRRGAGRRRRAGRSRVANTRPDVNVDEILQDARRRHARVPAAARAATARAGCAGSGDDAARDLPPLRADAPRPRRGQRAGGAGGAAQLRRVVHSLRLLSEELAGRDERAGRAGPVVGARSSGRSPRRTGRSRASIARLPGGAARDAAGARARRRPGARAAAGGRPSCARSLARLEPGREALEPLAREATPVVRDEPAPVRARGAAAGARALRPPARPRRARRRARRAASTSPTTLLNMLAYNPDGREGPDDADREEGFLFWLGWATTTSSRSSATADAHGPLRALAPAGQLRRAAGLADVLGQGDPLLGTVLGGLQGVFTDPARLRANASTSSSAFARRCRRGPDEPLAPVG